MKKINHFTKELKKQKKIIDYEENTESNYYLVPTVKELNEYLYKFHTKACYANYKELKTKFLINKIGL